MEVGDWITLAAVIVALGIGIASILHTRSMQKRERRERLLNEIIDWASEITKPITGEIFDNLVREAGNQSKIRLYINSHIAKALSDLSGLLGKNVYIKGISFSFDKNITLSIDTLITELNKYMIFLNDWFKKSSDELLANKVIDEEDFKKVGSIDARVKKCAVNVIEQAVSLKTKNIN